MSRNPESTRKSSTSVDGDSYVPALGQPHRRSSRGVAPPPGLAGMGRRLSLMRRASRATSFRTDQSVPLVPRLENSYRLGPADSDQFNPSKVSSLAGRILVSFLTNESYNAQKCAQLSQSLSDVIKSRVKEMNCPRYKFVCQVTIGEAGGQGIYHTSRCMWNTTTDNFATATYNNASLFAVANVYGLYYE